MAAFDTFVQFVNDEIVKRISTNDYPTSWVADKIIVATGVGLGVVAKSLAELNLVTQSVVDTLEDNILLYIDALTTANIDSSTDRRYLTDAQLTVVSNTSGTNSGDETQASIKTKLGAASGSVDGYLTSANWNTFNGKEPAIASGTTAQYLRGDKTFQTLNADVVSETASRVFLSPAQKTVATQAASSTQSGYLSSTDWSTFNNKQAALADVITAGAYGNSTQWPIVTVNAKGIVTGVTLQTVPIPTFTDANFSVQKAGNPSITASWSLTAFTASRVHTYPDKAINFGDLPSIASTDSNVLSGTRTRILGGSSNTVSGTDNVAIGCTGLNTSGATFVSCTMIGSNPATITAATKSIMLGMRNSYTQTTPVTGSLFLGASDNSDLFTYPVAAATVFNSLFASSDAFPVSGTLYATTNGSQTLSSSNCLPIPAALGTAQYEVDFIVSVGTVGLASTACVATGCTVMRRIFTVFRLDPTTAYISAVDTVGTDHTLGTISGTFTPTIALSGTTHVTVGITRAGGVAGQAAMAISARVRAHLTR